MTKKFEYNCAIIKITLKSDGSYTISGLGESIDFSEPSVFDILGVWNNCDNDKDHNLCLEVRREAYMALKEECYL